MRGAALAAAGRVTTARAGVGPAWTVGAAETSGRDLISGKVGSMVCGGVSANSTFGSGKGVGAGRSEASCTANSSATAKITFDGRSPTSLRIE